MAQSLIIVESPAKAKTISKFLGSKFKVQASMGHLRDLPKSQIGVDIDKGYEPKYITIRGKGQLVNALKKEAKKADKVYLATDPDREGEAISWHLATLLGLDKNEKLRIEFHEITKNAVLESIKHPRKINESLVNAQQARRILDRLVGYEISPILWKKVKWGLSAGRVQSVAVKLICDREKEIREFVPQEYWSVTAKLKCNKGTFESKLHSHNGKKISLENKEQVDAIVKDLSNSDFIVVDVKKSEKRKSPPPPFTTSTLQQEAYRKINFSTKKTMSIAQQLYEGIDIKKEGTIGLITYMRTDSTRISEESQESAKKYILDNFGKDYVSNTKKTYKAKGNIQDAHEAIRPTSIHRHPDSIKDSLTNDQYKLYKLIWSRFLASQMSEAVYDTVSIEIKAGEYTLKSSGSLLKFKGFLVAYETEEDEKDVKMPDLQVNEVLNLESIEPKQHFTQPPPRYTEATLVKAMEEKGIGRPSTYSPIISTIIERGYVVNEKKALVPTELGEVVTELLKEYFQSIVDEEFTAKMEKRLDEIEEGKDDWVKVVDDYYKPLKELIKIAESEIDKITIDEQVETTDILCEKCNRNMVIKRGRFGKFLACPGYPECKNTKPVLEELDVICPKCNGKIVIRKSKKGRVFYGCSNYPECDFVSWDKPTNERCPECNSILTEKNTKGKKQYKCLNSECNFKRIENQS
jgi:DNA topoisomerase-1